MLHTDTQYIYTVLSIIDVEGAESIGLNQKKLVAIAGHSYCQRLRQKC